MNNTIKDMHNNDVHIGDIVLAAKAGELYTAKFLGATPKAIKLSCYRKKWIADDPAEQKVSEWKRIRGKWVEDPKGVIHDEPDHTKHNGVKRIGYWNGTPNQTNNILKIS